MSTSCKTVPLSDRLVLIWRVKLNWQYVEIDPASIPWVNEVDVCECLETCEVTQSLRAQDKYLSSLIQQNENEINRIKDKNKSQDDEIQWLKDKDKSQDSVINMINTEISWLKTEYINVMNQLEWLWVHVILDEDYLSFDEWCQNVYIPNCATENNKFKEWDWYFNGNQSIAADQAVYVNVRPEDSTEPCSADDWYRLPYSLPVLEVIWIDPVYVSHPYKWRFEVWIDKRKLADVIADMETLDLSNVKVYLWDVYLDWVIKESLKIQENLVVWDHIETKNLTVKEHIETDTIHAKEWCIEEITCDTTFDKNVNINKSLDVVWNIDVSNIKVGSTTETTELNVHHHIETESIHANEGCIEHFTCDTDHGWNTIITWDTIIDNSSVTTVVNNVQQMNVTEHTHLEWDVVIKSDSFNLIDPNTWEKTCLQNLAKNSYNPSYWFFEFWWDCNFTSPWESSTCVLWLWNNIIWLINQYENEKVWPAQKCTLIPIWDKNKTTISWDTVHQTSWVWFDDKWLNCPVIHWSQVDYAWIYKIDFQVTIWFDEESSALDVWMQWSRESHIAWDVNRFNIYAHRWWIAVFEESKVSEYKLYDDKHAKWHDIWHENYKITIPSHAHSYYDYDDISPRPNSTTWQAWAHSYEYFFTSPESVSSSHFTNWDPKSKVVLPDWTTKDLFVSRWLWRANTSRHINRSDDHYTYSVSVIIPVDKEVYIAPYIKLSTWWTEFYPVWKLNITNSAWITWWQARLSIAKIWNLETYELHCED